MAYLPRGFSTLPTYKSTQDVGKGSSVAVLQPYGLQAFRHDASGVRIVTFQTDGPMVSCTIVVGTESVSNAGHAHTLEHLVFLGSQKYPQRGYLDSLACRSLAYGTNAWTANEYTAYTTKTAGKEGMRRILPVFLDHVLHPRITQMGVESEVYFVGGDGNEGGVVFCEMKARGNSEADLADRTLREMVFENGGLKFEAGGVCQEIRTLKKEDIEQFHREQYCGENVTIVVGGAGSEVLEWLHLDGVRRGSVRWGEIWGGGFGRRIVRFPSDEEEIGSVVMGWGGGGGRLAMEVLVRYLGGEVWAPLRQKFVEEECWAGDLDGCVEGYGSGWLVSLCFEGVAHKEEEDEEDEDDEDDEEDEDTDGGSIESLEKEGLLLSGKLEAEVMKLLNEIVQNGLPGGVEAVRVACRKESEGLLTELEGGSHDAVPMHLIEEVVYGEKEGVVIGQSVRGFLEELKALEEKDEAFWKMLIQKHLLDAPRAEVVMVPDPQLATRLAEEEQEALEKRKQQLGEHGLQALAKREQERKQQSTNSFTNQLPPLPDTSGIPRLEYRVDKFDANYHAHSITISTDFIHATLFMDTSTLSQSQRMLLPIICDVVPTCDIHLGDNQYIAYTDNARSISESTASTDRSQLFLGFSGNRANNCLVLHYAAQPHLFAEATSLWLRTLFCAEITISRMTAVAQSLMSTAQSELRDAEAVLSAAVGLVPYLNYNGELPNTCFTNDLGCLPLIEFLAAEFGKTKPKKSLLRSVIREMHSALNNVRSVGDEQVCIQIAARKPELGQRIFENEWKKVRRGIQAEMGEKGKHPVTWRPFMKLEQLMGKCEMGKIVSVAGVEGCFFEVRVDCDVNIAHKDWAALAVTCEMLSRMEGPLCQAVRGRGLAYSVGIGNVDWGGQLVCEIGESAAPAAAWEAVCECVREFGKGVSDGTDMQDELETARTGTLFRVYNGRSTVERVMGGVVSRLAVGEEAGMRRDVQIEEEVRNVSLRDVSRVFEKYISRILHQGVFVVVCGSDVEQVVKEFAQCRYKVNLDVIPIENVCPKVVKRVVKGLKLL